MIQQPSVVFMTFVTSRLSYLRLHYTADEQMEKGGVARGQPILIYVRPSMKLYILKLMFGE